MAEGGYDHVVLGSTPLAGLLAGLLAVAHGRRVALVGEPFSPFRLQRGIDLSVGVVTRPETLLLLKRVSAETVRLVGGWGKGLAHRTDALFAAETPESIAALSHFRHLALALGYAVEPLADHHIATGAIVRVRDAQMLAHGRFEPALEAWLGQHDVRRLDRADTSLTLRRDGTVRVVHDGRTVEAAHAILADDAAILEHLDEEGRDRSLEAIPTRVLLLEAGKALAAPVVEFLDRGVTVSQDGRSSLAAIVAGDPATAHARLGASIAKAGPLRLAGEAVLAAIRSRDGAPFVGPARGSKLTVLAGLGHTGAFLAPAIARHIAGAAPPDEAAWFAARGALRGNQRQLAADYLPVPA